MRGAVSAADFRRVKGIGPVKAQQLVSVLEISRRMLEQQQQMKQQLSGDVRRLEETILVLGRQLQQSQNHQLRQLGLTLMSLAAILVLFAILSFWFQQRLVVSRLRLLRDAEAFLARAELVIGLPTRVDPTPRLAPVRSA